MQFKKHPIIMLPSTRKIIPFENLKDSLVKCIKEWTPVGEESVKVGTMSYCVNHSPGVLNYYQRYDIYALSDEPLVQGDWAYSVIMKNIVRIFDVRTECGNNQGFPYKKIIATTDTSISIVEDTLSIPQRKGLTNHYPVRKQVIPGFSKSFLKKFASEANSGNVITEVLLEYKLRPLQFDGINSRGNSVYFCPNCGDSDSYMGTTTPNCYKNSCLTLKIDGNDWTVTTRKIKHSWDRKEFEQILRAGLQEVIDHYENEDSTYEKVISIDKIIEKHLL